MRSNYKGNVIQSGGNSGYNAAINYWNLMHPDHKMNYSTAGFMPVVDSLMQ